jgi:mannose/fructose/N-acetylgalactosamine-specific phosphotransferase system component IID
MSTPLTRAAITSSFLRSFLIQGSWNYRTMLGSGFAFAMLPGLSRLFGGNRERLEAAIARHAGHFNAHPYLACIALGAALRMEADGADPEEIQRFKTAVRGPLGGLGDALIWATWLPSVSMAAVALYWFGAPGWVAVVFFLTVYNAGHLALRTWGFAIGLQAGQRVGQRLADAALADWTSRLRAGGVLILGLLSGAVLGGGGGLADSGVLWTGLAGAGFVLGLLVGHHVWRPTAVAVVGAIMLIGAWGILP